jgi:hypothetical protein
MLKRKVGTVELNEKATAATEERFDKKRSEETGDFRGEDTVYTPLDE